MRGDIILYKAKPGDLADWLISVGSGGGEFIHSEIDLGNGKYVGEHGTGIVVHAKDAPTYTIAVHPTSNRGEAGIEGGMQWVELVIKQELANPSAHKYGWLDILADATKDLGRTLLFKQPGAWDCSHFVTLYLMVAGAAGPLGSKVKTPETVTPNDIAAAFGVS